MKSSLKTVIPIRSHLHLANRLKPKCSLIADTAGRLPIAVAEVAALRGIAVESSSFADGSIAALVGAPSQLIALSLATYVELPTLEKARLKKLVEAGAIVYLRGSLEHGRRCSLAPLADADFECSTRTADGYRFSSHWILPSAIARETSALPQDLNVALGQPPLASPLMISGIDGDGDQPVIFAIEIGAGIVICDLHDEIAADSTPLISRLSDPRARAAVVGALAAVDYAGGRDASVSAPVNLVIDDRPINRDFFNSGKTERFLRHLDSRYLGVHTDFAWTPDQTRVSRRYVKILRDHNTGFVWHGLMRHLDHRSIMDLETDLAHGRQLVRGISAKYEVRIQPVMIFPYEKDSPVCDDLLRRSGFVAKVKSFDPDPNALPHSYFRLRAAQPERPTPASTIHVVSRDDESPPETPFRVLFRDEDSKLTRDRMLALAILGLPIIALAHPYDLGVQRFRRTRDSIGPTYFDRVLAFAAAKSLRPMSLENIAAEMPPTPPLD